jgi:translation initiation factor 1 (eIF-1/SUI1)
MLGYQPTFSASNVQSISLRQNTVFKRKTITVSTGKDKINKYYLYYQLTNSASPQKLYACGCKGTNRHSETEIWTDVLGVQGQKSTKVDDIMSHDEVAAQVNKFLKVSSPETADWKITQLEINEYDLKLEYTATFTL